MTFTQAVMNNSLRNDLVGFDRIFDRMHTLNSIQQKQSNYPPYNIVKTDENLYTIEIAVAGFIQDEIDITVEDGVMKVSGNKKLDESETEYVHKGIAARDFTRSFTLADTVEVRGASLVNGILQIGLENVIPEEKKPRKIDIGSSEKVFLAED